jgi:uncharacterized membrane protein
MESKETYKVDIMGIVDQTVDATVNKMFIKSLEENGDPIAHGLFLLLNEYGIYGQKALEFINKAATLFEILKATGDIEEEEKTECS